MVFLSITLGVWAILTALGDRNGERRGPAAADHEPGNGRKENEAQVAGRQEKFQAQVTKAANKLGQSLRPSDEQELGKVRLKLLNAGFRTRTRWPSSTASR